MDIQQLTDAQLIAKAFGVSGAQAEESIKLFFPARGECFAMDSARTSLRDRLAAAIEIDRRMARVSLESASSPTEVKALIRRVIGGQEHESFWVVFLDSQNKVIATRELSKGTVTQCSVYPRELVKGALALNASSVILAHNHPLC
jgi:DNA repair protein RadC